MAAIESLLRERTDQGVPTVDVIDNVDRFGALRAEWIDLLQNSSSHNPFLSWEWLHAWWTHLGESRRLQILTVRDDDGRLVGVAPLCGSRGRWPWLSQLEFLATGWAGSDYLDLIVRRGYEDDCARRLHRLASLARADRAIRSSAARRVCGNAGRSADLVWLGP